MQIHKIELTLKDYTALNTKLKFKQHDTGAHRLAFTGIDMSEGTYALVKMRRADGKTVVSDKLYADKEESISYLLEAAVECKGTVAAEVSVYSESGARITTNTFFYEVVPDINTDNIIETDDRPVIDRLLQESHTHENKNVLDNLDTLLSKKVDKVSGKDLSTNDFTNEFKTKLEGLPYTAELLKYMRFEHTNYDSGYAVMSMDELPLPYNANAADDFWIDRVYLISNEMFGLLMNSNATYYGYWCQFLFYNEAVYIRSGNTGNGIAYQFDAYDTGWQTYKTEVKNSLTSTSTTAALSAYQGKILNDSKADKINVNWQLIDSAELTKDVQSVSKTLGGNYRDLYIVFRVPTMNADAASDFQKARAYVYIQNDVKIYDDGNYMYADRGNTWLLSFRISMIYNFLNLTRTFNHTASYIDDAAYAFYPDNAGSTVGYVRDKKLTENYISSVKITLYPNNTRYFPAGTTYEIWGIKA